MSKYKTYKPSGIDWIGEVPAHWERRKIGRCFNVIGSGTTPEAGKDDFYEDGNINWLLTGDLNDGIINFCEKKITQSAFDRHSVLKVYPRESVVIALYGATIGKTGLLNIEAATNQACCVLADSQCVIPKFAFYLLNSAKEKLLFESYGGGQPNISQEIIRQLRIYFPAKEEQYTIANYLDDQTKKIDQLISNKKAQAEKLKELRQIEINNAVTKGLNKNVKLKDSGIDWLSKIPMHWEVRRLKNIADVKYGLGQPPDEKENGLPLIRATNVERGKINDKDLIFVDPADVPYDRDPVLKENDIIVVRSGAYTADSAIIPKKYEGAIAGYDMVMRVVKSSPLFISYCLLSNYLLVNQLFLERLRAAQPHLNKEELSKALVVVPPLPEQIQIANYLAERTNTIDNLLHNIKEQIEKLQELRKIKIYEAVTGKIKVEAYAEATA